MGFGGGDAFDVAGFLPYSFGCDDGGAGSHPYPFRSTSLFLLASELEKKRGGREGRRQKGSGAVGEGGRGRGGRGPTPSPPPEPLNSCGPLPAGLFLPAANLEGPQQLFNLSGTSAQGFAGVWFMFIRAQSVQRISHK